MVDECEFSRMLYLSLTNRPISSNAPSRLTPGVVPDNAEPAANPKNEAKTVTEVTLKNESMSTSGNYEKFFWAEGRIYSHIMDPRTGFPATGMLSASVITPRTLDSEAWTKPFFINGRSWASKHTPNGFRVFLCPDTGEMGTEQSCALLQ